MLVFKCKNFQVLVNLLIFKFQVRVKKLVLNKGF